MAEAFLTGVGAALASDQAEGLRRLMAARPAALARQRSAAAGGLISAVVLACDDALAQALARQLSHALNRLSPGHVRLASSPAQVAGQVPPAVRAADHVLLALDGREAHLSASLTWGYALLKHWHAAGHARDAADPRDRPAHNPAHQARLVLCGVQRPAQAQRALANLSDLASRDLGRSLRLAGSWCPDAGAAAPELARLAAALLQWPLAAGVPRS